MSLTIQILVILLAPIAWTYFSKSLKVEKWLSPVVLCYLTGILIKNLNLLEIDKFKAEAFAEYSVVLAIPLLLFSTDIVKWLKHAKSSVLSFFLCVLSVLICSVATFYYFKDEVAESAQISGMLVGVYTGGTPNMNAIGIALGVSEETVFILNIADILCGGVLLVFLTSVAHTVLSKWLPAFKGDKQPSIIIEEREKSIPWKDGAISIILSLSILASSAAITYSIFGSLNKPSFILLLLTTMSISASLISPIRNLSGSFKIGEYLLLVFCVAIGMQADFANILAMGSTIILYTAVVLASTICLHLILAKIFKIDVDTWMITATAALYGPVFVGQIASTIENRALIVSGMATGLVGYAIGNYLGVLVANVLL